MCIDKQIHFGPLKTGYLRLYFFSEYFEVVFSLRATKAAIARLSPPSARKPPQNSRRKKSSAHEYETPSGNVRKRVDGHSFQDSHSHSHSHSGVTFQVWNVGMRMRIYELHSSSEHVILHQLFPK